MGGVVGEGLLQCVHMYIVAWESLVFDRSWGGGGEGGCGPDVCTWGGGCIGELCLRSCMWRAIGVSPYPLHDRLC